MNISSNATTKQGTTQFLVLALMLITAFLQEKITSKWIVYLKLLSFCKRDLFRDDLVLLN